MCRLQKPQGARGVTGGADLLLQLLQPLLLQLTGQRSGHQEEPGDPEGALAKHQVGCCLSLSAT